MLMTRDGLSEDSIKAKSALNQRSASLELVHGYGSLVNNYLQYFPIHPSNVSNLL